MGKRIREAIVYGAVFAAGTGELSGQTPKPGVKLEEKKLRTEVKKNSEIGELLDEIETKKKQQNDKKFLTESGLTSADLQNLVDGLFNEVSKIVVGLLDKKQDSEYRKIALDNAIGRQLLGDCIKASNNPRAVPELSDLAKFRLKKAFNILNMPEGGIKEPPKM